MKDRCKKRAGCCRLPWRAWALCVLGIVGWQSCNRCSQPVGEGRSAGNQATQDAGVVHGEPAGALHVSATDYDFSRNPQLLNRVRESVFGYFRFINIPFSQRVCERFHAWLRSMPTVNLHGDAHLENYVVTDAGRGLSDFDDSSAGPAVIDLVRFGVSIALAAEIRGWQKQRPDLLERFLRGYRAALRDPQIKGSPPRFVARARAGFDKDPRVFLRFAESLMGPMTEPERAELTEGHERYQRLMLGEHPDLDEAYFRLKRIGRITLGFGSALDRKYLLRIEGPSPAGEDDLILEAKEVRDLSAIDCVYARASGGAFRVLVGQARIAEVTDRFLAQVPQAPDSAPEQRPFWIHAWRPHYLELDVRASLLGPDELAEVVYDVGLQLGRGHTRKIAAPLDSQLRHAQLRSVIRFDADIRGCVVQLTEAVSRGWEQFRREVPEPGR